MKHMKIFNKINNKYNVLMKKMKIDHFFSSNILLCILAIFTIAFFTCGIINNTTTITNQLNEDDYLPVPITSKKTFSLNTEGIKQANYISIKTGTYDKKINSVYKFIFYKNNKKIYSKKVSPNEIKDNSVIKFNINIINNTDDKYTVKIIPITSDSENTIAVFANSRNEIFGNYEKKSDNTVFCCVIYFIVLISFFIINYLIKTKEYSIEKIFLLFSVSFLIISIIIPPFHAPDEFYHFTQSYGLTERFNSDKATSFPKNYRCLLYGWDSNNVENTHSIYKCLTSKKSKETMHYDTRLQSHNIAHMVLSIPIKITRFITDSPIIIFFIGRIMNLVVNLIILYKSLKLLPFGKKNLLLIVSIPVLIQQFVTYSYDGLANSISILLVSYILNLAFVKNSINIKNHIIIIILLFLVMNLKIPYAVLGVLFFIVPKEKFDNKIIKKYAIISLVLLISLISYKVFNVLINTNNFAISSSESNTLIELIRNPIYSLRLFKNTIFTNLKFYIITMIGGLDWLNLYMNYFYINIIVFMLLILLGTGENKLENKDRILCLAINIIIFTGILLALCIGWTDANASVINGVQGRYFLPLLLPLSCVFLTNKKYINISDEFVGIFSNIVIISYIFTLLIAYY